MSDSPVVLDLVPILRKVPDSHLHVFDLAEALRLPDGTFDLDGAALREVEMEQAEREAATYTVATRRVTEALQLLLQP